MDDLLITLVIAFVLRSPLKDHQLYIDPGSGSFIFQLIIATLVGAIFVIKMYWKKIRSYINKILHRDSGHPEE